MSKKNELIDIDVLMGQKFGKDGAPEREKFREDAYDFCVGQMISEARKQEKNHSGRVGEASHRRA